MTKNLAAFLRDVPLFASIGAPSLIHMAQASRVLRLSKGKLLFQKGDAAEAVFVVLAGSIALVLGQPDGRELVINEMQVGDCFGEMAVVTNLARSTGAMAHQASEVVVIPRIEFLAVMDAEPKLMRRMIDLLAQRLRASSERESALAFLTAPARLARLLLQMDRQANKEGRITSGQEELAQHLGLTRQTVAKTLGQWRRSGLLLTGRGKIVLLDKAALRLIADETEG